MEFEQKQIKKCPVCNCDFFGENSNHLYLDWVVVIKSEKGFVPLLRCSGCYSPFYIKREDGKMKTYLGNATD